MSKTSHEIQDDLLAAGLTVNMKKSNFYPSHTGKWLGFEIDTNAMKFSVPSKKVASLLHLIGQALNSIYVTAKQIAKIAGHIISMSIAIGPLTRLFTRQMYRFIDKCASWG